MPSTQPPRPTILHLLYTIALLGASIALFGMWGIAIGLILLVAWAYIYWSRSRPRALRQIVIGMLLIGSPALLFPTVGTIPDNHICSMQLRRIALAIQQYEMAYQCYPPAYIADDQGQPIHSWRVLILPYLESDGRPFDHKGVYQKYDFSQPWNSPHNLKLARQHVPYHYVCPEIDPKTNNGFTSFFAVVDPNTAWPGATSRYSYEIYDFDGNDSTLLLLEDDSRQVLWTEPTDIGFDEAVSMLSDRGRVAPHWIGNPMEIDTFRNAAFCNGCGRIRQGITTDQARSLLHINDGRAESLEALNEARELRESFWRLIIPLVSFLGVLLLPLRWVWSERDNS